MQVPRQFPLEKDPVKKLYFATAPFGFTAICEIDGKMGRLVFSHQKGLPYNGASNPLDWPIKNYYGDSKKDACGLGHDDLFAWGGFVQGLGRSLSFGECNDYIRGSMREAGFGRTDAGIVDRACRLFSYFRHFGVKNDREGMHNFCSISWIQF